MLADIRALHTLYPRLSSIIKPNNSAFAVVVLVLLWFRSDLVVAICNKIVALSYNRVNSFRHVRIYLNQPAHSGHTAFYLSRHSAWKILSALERLHVTESGFWNPEKFCWGNQDSWALESGIQIKNSGEIPLTFGIQNLSSAGKDWNPLTWLPKSYTGFRHLRVVPSDK